MPARERHETENLAGAGLASPGEPPEAPTLPPRVGLAALGRKPRLGDPVPLDSIEPNVPYVIADGLNRFLMPDKYGAEAWNYAFFGTYGDYGAYLIGSCFMQDPMKNPSRLWLGPPVNPPSVDKRWLRAKGKEATWEYVAFASASYNSEYPYVSLQAVFIGSLFKLRYMNGEQSMYLTAKPGAGWQWAYVTNDLSEAPFLSLRKLYITRDDVTALVQSAWPTVTIDVNAALIMGDHEYELVAKAKATQIYSKAGLSRFTYTPNVFDCEDFSMVLKSQACQQAYDDSRATGNAVARAYAFGLLWAKPHGSTPSTDDGHAANFIVDLTGTLMVIEPQTGGLMTPDHWKDNNGNAYIPSLIML